MGLGRGDLKPYESLKRKRCFQGNLAESPELRKYYIVSIPNLTELLLLQCTLFSTVHIVQCKVRIAQCTLHTVQCTVHSVQCAVVHTVQCTVHSVQYAVHTVKCTVHSVQCTVHPVQCTVHPVQYSAELVLLPASH